MAGREREGVRIRTLLAQSCARILAEEGVVDFLVAKRKAAQRLGVGRSVTMPSNIEIQEALTEYRRLFGVKSQEAILRNLRAQARSAMQYFSVFRPRLVGGVLEGVAGMDAAIELHLFADRPEDVQLFLMENQIPFDAEMRRFRLGRDVYCSCPVFQFVAGDVSVELTIFPLVSEREAPRSGVDGKPMRRARLKEVESLLG